MVGAFVWYVYLCGMCICVVCVFVWYAYLCGMCICVVCVYVCIQSPSRPVLMHAYTLFFVRRSNARSARLSAGQTLIAAQTPGTKLPQLSSLSGTNKVRQKF